MSPDARRSAGRRVAVALVAFTIGVVAAVAQELPPEVQAVLLKKTFLFDPLLGDKTAVLVVFTDAGEEPAAQRLAKAFRAAEVRAEVVRADAAGNRVPATGAVYFMGTSADDGLRRLCIEHRRLSVAGTVALAEAGRVAIAVGVSPAGSPEIVVHRARLAEEGHKLEPRLLKLARVVG